LVKISAIWYRNETWRTQTWPRAIFSRTKWTPISICLVYWCWTRLPKR